MRLALCNCPSPEVAERLANKLIEDRLAACVNIIPGVTSVYRWEGKVCRDQEWTLLIKTMEEALPRLLGTVKAQHPYALPEVVVLDVDVALSHRPYVDWVAAECGPGRP